MKFIPNAISVKVARAALVSEKHSPETLFIAGLVGMGATVVLACKATLKVDGIVLRAETSLDKIESVRNSPDYPGQYTEKDVKKDKAIVCMRAVGELSKAYGPAILCGVISVSALAGSHNILTKRNAALAAAYGTIEKTFGEYRDRVAAEVGREKENEIYHAAEVCEIEDEVTGKKTKALRSTGGSPYARLFEPSNPNYEPTPEYNVVFLKLQQNWANQRLHAKGHLFLNEVYDNLGLERSKEGAVVGWISDGSGDNYVDFGIFVDNQSERIVDFMIGREKSVWLDFNVDGTIYDKI